MAVDELVKREDDIVELETRLAEREDEIRDLKDELLTLKAAGKLALFAQNRKAAQERAAAEASAAALAAVSAAVSAEATYSSESSTAAPADGAAAAPPAVTEPVRQLANPAENLSAEPAAMAKTTSFAEAATSAVESKANESQFAAARAKLDGKAEAEQHAGEVSPDCF